MARAKLSITVPEQVWIGDLSRSEPDATFRILAAYSLEDSGVGLVEIRADDPVAVVERMADYGDVTDLVVLQRGDDSLLAQFETSAPLLLFAVHTSGVPLELPFRIEGGEAVWEVTASRDRLSALADRFDELGITYQVEWIRQYVEDEPVLTETQHRIIETAAGLGYYDTPRSCTLTDLADHLDLAKSTVSETLHRAESAVVKEYLAPED